MNKIYMDDFDLNIDNYDLEDILMGLFTGIKPLKVDLKRSMNFFVTDLKNIRTEAPQASNMYKFNRTKAEKHMAILREKYGKKEDDDDVDGCQQTVSRRVYSIFPQHFSQRYIQHNHSRPLTFFTGAPLGCPYPLPPYPPFGECPWP